MWCRRGCLPRCLGCRDEDLSFLRLVPEGTIDLDVFPGRDPLCILVDGKYKPNSQRWSVGIYHPHSGAARWMAGLESSLLEAGDTGNGIVQWRAEMLAVSVGCRWLWTNREFASAASCKYCIDGELPTYTIFTDQTCWIPRVRNFLDTQSTSSNRKEHPHQLLTLVAHIQTLAARSTSVVILHKSMDPQWASATERQWPPDKVAARGIKHRNAVALEPRTPLDIPSLFSCSVEREGSLNTILIVKCTDHVRANLAIYNQSMNYIMNFRWRGDSRFAYYQSNGDRITAQMTRQDAVAAFVVCRKCYKDRRVRCTGFTGYCCPHIPGGRSTVVHVPPAVLPALYPHQFARRRSALAQSVRKTP